MNKFDAFTTFDFDHDAEFQRGCTQIINQHGGEHQNQEYLVWQLKAFYFSQVYASVCIDRAVERAKRST
jgi:hypothetical protein